MKPKISSPYTGVEYDAATGRWKAMFGRKRTVLGSYDSPAEAADARAAALHAMVERWNATPRPPHPLE